MLFTLIFLAGKLALSAPVETNPSDSFMQHLILLALFILLSVRLVHRS
jgi:hypothetical protein